MGKGHIDREINLPFADKTSQVRLTYNEGTWTLTFAASEFSTYAIAYKTAKRSDADYDYVPGTGNTTGLGLWTGMLLFGLAVLACTEVLRKRKHI